MSPEEKDALLKECVGLLQLVPSALVRDQYLETLRKKLGLKSIHAALPAASPVPARRLPGTPQGGSGERGRQPVHLPGSRRHQGRVGFRARVEPAPDPAFLRGTPAAWPCPPSRWTGCRTRHVRNLADHLLAFVEESGGLDLRSFRERLSDPERDSITAVGIARRHRTRIG